MAFVSDAASLAKRWVISISALLSQFTTGDNSERPDGLTHLPKPGCRGVAMPLPAAAGLLTVPVPRRYRGQVNGAAGVKRRGVLCACGITHDGLRELIDFRQARSAQPVRASPNRGMSQYGHHRRVRGSPQRPRHRLPLSAGSKVLGPQAQKRCRKAATENPGALPGWIQDHLPGPYAKRGRHTLPTVGRTEERAGPEHRHAR